MKNPTLTIPTALISTRHHGMVDYAVAALFGGLSMSLGSRALPVEVRRLLAGAAVIHAGYAALTDYEAGFYPLITMRQHLALDHRQRSGHEQSLGVLDRPRERTGTGDGGIQTRYTGDSRRDHGSSDIFLNWAACRLAAGLSRFF